MSGRKPTPDLLDNVLKGGRREGGRQPERQDAKPSSRHDVIPSEIKAKPFKLTSYIDADLNDEADMAVIKFKKRVGKVNKSIMVEEALRICLSDPIGTGFEAALRERNQK